MLTFGVFWINARSSATSHERSVTIVSVRPLASVTSSWASSPACFGTWWKSPQPEYRAMTWISLTPACRYAVTSNASYWKCSGQLRHGPSLTHLSLMNSR